MVNFAKRIEILQYKLFVSSFALRPTLFDQNVIDG